MKDYKRVIEYGKMIFDLSPEREYNTLFEVLTAGKASFRTAQYYHGATMLAEQLATYLDEKEKDSE